MLEVLEVMDTLIVEHLKFQIMEEVLVELIMEIIEVVEEVVEVLILQELQKMEKIINHHQIVLEMEEQV